MRRGDLMIVGFIVLIVLCSVFSLWTMAPKAKEDLYVLIRVNGEVYTKVSLHEPQTLFIENMGEYNEILIDSQGVSMHSASCENQACVLQGKATAENLLDRILGGWIICLPNKVGVEVIGGPLQ